MCAAQFTTALAAVAESAAKLAPGAQIVVAAEPLVRAEVAAAFVAVSEYHC